MKYGKVAKLLKASKRIEVFLACDCQWVSEGAAAYPMRGMPLLGRDNIFDLFGVAVDKRSDYRYAERECPEAYNFHDWDGAERILERSGAMLVFDGQEYMPVSSDAGALLIDPQYLAPFGDREYELYERTDGYGQRYIAVKHGMGLIGIIMPLRVSDDLVDAIGELYHSVRLATKYARNDDGQIGLAD